MGGRIYEQYSTTVLPFPGQIQNTGCAGIAMVLKLRNWMQSQVAGGGETIIVNINRKNVSFASGLYFLLRVRRSSFLYFLSEQ